MKLCKLCHKYEATVPDRDKPGRPVKAICSRCHADRLLGDLKRIMDRRNAAKG